VKQVSFEVDACEFFVADLAAGLVVAAMRCTMTS
jgi:hypothetical protein